MLATAVLHSAPQCWLYGFQGMVSQLPSSPSAILVRLTYVASRGCPPCCSSQVPRAWFSKAKLCQQHLQSSKQIAASGSMFINPPNPFFFDRRYVPMWPWASFPPVALCPQSEGCTRSLALPSTTDRTSQSTAELQRAGAVCPTGASDKPSHGKRPHSCTPSALLWKRLQRVSFSSQVFLHALPHFSTHTHI